MAKAELTELLHLQTELARVQERFATLEAAAEGCCKSVLRATELAVKLEPTAITDPELRTHVESLRKATQQLKGFEHTLHTQVKELRRPLQQLEALGFRRE